MRWKVIDIIRELHEFGARLTDWESLAAADALIVAVAHRRYLEPPNEALMRKERSRVWRL